MQENGIDFHNGAGPKALGITKKQFDKKCTDLAVALWRKTMRFKDAATENPPQDIVFFEYLSNFSNIFESIEITNADMGSDKAYAVLGLTKKDFQYEARFAAHTVLRGFEDYAKGSETGGQAVFEQVVNCLKLGGLDPETDEPYQLAGHVSRADLLEKLEGWKKAADERPHGHSCCGGHSHAPDPTPSS